MLFTIWLLRQDDRSVCHAGTEIQWPFANLLPAAALDARMDAMAVVGERLPTRNPPLPKPSLSLVSLLLLAKLVEAQLQLMEAAVLLTVTLSAVTGLKGPAARPTDSAVKPQLIAATAAKADLVLDLQ